MAVVVFMTIVMLSWLTGIGLLRFFRVDAGRMVAADPLLESMLGFIMLSQLYCLLGLFGILQRSYFLMSSAVLVLPGVFLLWQKRTQYLNQALACVKRLTWPAVLCIALLPMLLLALTVATLPPLNWDEISYALTFPKLHIAAGNVSYLTQYGIFSAFPLFGETPIGIPYLLVPSPTGSHLVVLVFLFASLMLAFRLAGALFESRLNAWLCVIALAYLPLTLGNIGTAKIELYQLAYILAAFLMLVRYSQQPHETYRVLSYVFIAFAAGIKYTTIFAAPFYLCAYLMATPIQRGVLVHVKEICRLVLIGIAINAVWLIVNWHNVCNPFFPNLVGVFGQCLKYPVTKDIMDMVMEGTMWQKGTSWSTTHSLENFKALFIAGFGTINSLLLIVALSVFAVRKKSRSLPHLNWIFGGIVLTLLLQAFGIYWEFRYTYFAFTFFLLFIGAVLLQTVPGRLVRVATAVLLSLQAYQSWTAYFQHNPAVGFVMKGDIPRQGYPDKFVHLYWVAAWLNQNTPSNAVIAFNWGVQPFYYLDRTFYFLHDWNPEENIQLFDQATQLQQALRHRNASYLVWRNQDDSGYIDPSKSKAFRARMNHFVDELERSGWLRQVHSQDDVRIFVIQREASLPSPEDSPITQPK
ncbi:MULTISPECIES: hypothetical protein [unclassified Herbaspirillum]|uniref:hypothetical protein n=1 Tax=unclassified Herbaspirillum TaxID=2624150 RepID=UPI000C0967F3|nr:MULTISPECIES: hypothetical protein [unclassified Herbaspirillum]MAF02826.1 hypothetical protein [Herbaspirillum sp.]MBO15685.1 hypothetical protein [Herbaspirillum sp.]|tara:strand:+ start:1227 stop:3137 length:1911 start_codon:yes stop_codon:yes gene_type:complete